MSEPAIVAHGLAKSYGDVRALDGIDLEAREGSVLGVLGPNGAGKTTAVRILATLLKPDAGTARVAGFDVVREAGALRANIGLAGQNAAVDRTTASRPTERGERQHRLGRNGCEVPRRALSCLRGRKGPQGRTAVGEIGRCPA